jgi:hypothetical protein
MAGRRSASMITPIDLVRPKDLINYCWNYQLFDTLPLPQSHSQMTTYFFQNKGSKMHTFRERERERERGER